MSGTKNSFSSLIAQFLRIQKNSMEIVNKLNEVTTSSKDSVEIEFLMDDNTSKCSGIIWSREQHSKY